MLKNPNLLNWVQAGVLYSYPLYLPDITEKTDCEGTGDDYFHRDDNLWKCWVLQKGTKNTKKVAAKEPGAREKEVAQTEPEIEVEEKVAYAEPEIEMKAAYAEPRFEETKVVRPFGTPKVVLCWDQFILRERCNKDSQLRLHRKIDGNCWDVEYS